MPTISTILLMLLGAAILAAFVWLLIPSSNTSTRVDAAGNELIDPNDARQLGALFGMYGFDVVDAALAKFAVDRFQALYGRPPTTLDVGVLVGLMRERG